jgi:hypothetical protein
MQSALLTDARLTISERSGAWVQTGNRVKQIIVGLNAKVCTITRVHTTILGHIFSHLLSYPHLMRISRLAHRAAIWLLSNQSARITIPISCKTDLDLMD